jgi:hypothetical protein
VGTPTWQDSTKDQPAKSDNKEAAQLKQHAGGVEQVEGSNIKDSGVEGHNVKKPEVEDSDVEDLEAEDHDVKEPEAENHDIEESETGGLDLVEGGNLLKNHLKQAQQVDKVLRPIIQYLEEKELPDDQKEAQQIVLESGQMEIDKGLLLRHWWQQRDDQWTSTRLQVVVPATLTKEVMWAAHDHLLGGHLGEKWTLERIWVHYWWPWMYSHVKRWVASCPMCQQWNELKGCQPSQLQLIPLCTRPFERVGVDLVGPLPRSTTGNLYLLVFIDYLTKWPEVFTIPNMKATTVAKIFVEQIVCRHGAPEALLLDWGAQFLSEVLKEVNDFL